MLVGNKIDKVQCSYVRSDDYYLIFILKNWSFLPQFEPRDKLNILLTLVVSTISYGTLFFFPLRLRLGIISQAVVLINTPIWQYS